MKYSHNCMLCCRFPPDICTKALQHQMGFFYIQAMVRRWCQLKAYLVMIITLLLLLLL